MKISKWLKNGFIITELRLVFMVFDNSLFRSNYKKFGGIKFDLCGGCQRVAIFVVEVALQHRDSI